MINGEIENLTNITYEYVEVTFEVTESSLSASNPYGRGKRRPPEKTGSLEPFETIAFSFDPELLTDWAAWRFEITGLNPVQMKK